MYTAAANPGWERHVLFANQNTGRISPPRDVEGRAESENESAKSGQFILDPADVPNLQHF